MLKYMRKSGLVRAEIVREYANGRRDFDHEHFNRVDFSDLDLRGSSFKFSTFTKSNLQKTNFSGANLRFATFYESDLREAKFEAANLSFTNFYLSIVHYSCFDGADLSLTKLGLLDLSKVSLKGTCLDPKAEVPELSDSEILYAGLEIKGDFILGYRSPRSVFVGNMVYYPGWCYSAPVFSVGTRKCHPGLYFSGLKQAMSYRVDNKLVRVAAIRNEVVHVGPKWRAKRLLVLSEHDCNTLLC